MACSCLVSIRIGNPTCNITYIHCEGIYDLNIAVYKKWQKMANGIKTGMASHQHKIDCEACKLTKPLVYTLCLLATSCVVGTDCASYNEALCRLRRQRLMDRMFRQTPVEATHATYQCVKPLII